MVFVFQSKGRNTKTKIFQRLFENYVLENKGIYSFPVLAIFGRIRRFFTEPYRTKTKNPFFKVV